MTDENRDKLSSINNSISNSSYAILQKQQWDMYSRDLANCGADLLNDIEHARSDIREIRVKFTFWGTRKKLNRSNTNYDILARDFDLFYDSSMKFLRSIINNNKYEEYQILQKQDIKSLTEHCIKSLEYLGNLLSSKRNEYYHLQALNVSILAILIALLSFTMNLISNFIR